MESQNDNSLAKVLLYYNLIPDCTQLSQKIVCPFHEDINPSMIVNLEDNSWYCFGCNLAGDAIRFVKLMEEKNNKSNDLQAYKKYVKILKSDKASDIKLHSYKRSKKVPREDLYNKAHDYYYGLKKVNWGHSELPEEKEAFIYMKERGFTSKALKLCKAKVTYNRSYGIIFPMMDNGKFKGWVCRTMVKEIEGKRKYLYNEGFSRATTLVGDYGDKNYVFVVEGYMDRLKFLQNGENNVVAILGWKMSDEQIKKLKDKGIKFIISVLDNDACGIKGTNYLKNHFEVTRFAYLKGVNDPGEMNNINFNKMFRRTMKIFNEKK